MRFMKSTRQIFLINGKEENVRKVLSELRGFKAITVVDGKVTIGQIKKIFANNKSIVCRELDEENFILQFAPVSVIATDTSLCATNNIINTNHNIVRQFMEIALEHNIDIGDYVSNSNSLGPSKADCIFCKLLSGNPIHEQKSLYESNHFLVVPGSGGFIDGYLMILPKKHIMSCAELNPEQMEEIRNVISDIKFILKSIYHNEILIWENGSGTDGKGKPKTSIVHAHIHACPCSDKLNILKTIKLTGVSLTHIKSFELSSYIKNSYLLVIDFDNQFYISSDTKLYIPRQYIRQLLALNLGISGELWDWRCFPFWDNVDKTSQVFLQYVKNNYDNLSPRIQKATRNFI